MRTTIDERLIEATRGTGIGANMLHAFLTVERRDGRIDWREAALALAQAADRMNQLATEALTMAPPPLILVKPCPKCVAGADRDIDIDDGA